MVLPKFASRKLTLEIIVLVICIVFIISSNYNLNSVPSASYILNTIQSRYRIQSDPSLLTEETLSKSMRVYVYDLPPEYNYDLIKREPRCLTKIFAAEIYFHFNILSSPVRTLDPSEADWFFIPVYSTSHIHIAELNPYNHYELMSGAISYVVEKLPYWNRTNGADHFVIAPHDYGACFHFLNAVATKNDIPPWLKRTTIVQTFGHRHHVCMKEGSIIIPSYFNPLITRSFSSSSPPKKEIFIFFGGSIRSFNFSDLNAKPYSKNIRSYIYDRFNTHPMFVFSIGASEKYLKDMERSVFCLCPLGWAAWTPRLVESIASGCIPVLISDDIVLPFENAIPWKEIAVFVAEKDVGRLDRILTSISTEEIERMQKGLRQPWIRTAMLFPFPAQPGDAYHHVLRELSLKLPHSPETFIERGV